MNRILWFFLLVATVYCCAIGVDVMDADASQYAAMSREMNESGSYLQVYEQGEDYLDKPPFLFWVNSLSIAIFGENNFAFKLPSILFALLAVFATYRFARLYYPEKLALFAAAVLATCQAMFLITNDIRTDTILMSWVILASWGLAEWLITGKLFHFLLASAAIGGGMLTKGPIALIVPVLAFGSHLLLQRKFNYFFKPEYLAGLGVIALILLPMSIGLYLQFDLHPEKTVYGIEHVSGLRFFYWTQSFGRITGESSWDNHAPFSFLFENLLWGMLPWTLLFVSGLVHELVRWIKKGFRVGENDEFITFGGFVLAYLALGMSKYQLPHYIYVVLPFIAIITAKMGHLLVAEGRLRWLKQIVVPLQWVLVLGLLMVPFVLLKAVFPDKTYLAWLIPVTTWAISLLILGLKSIKEKVWAISLVAILGANVFLSVWFYPQLLQFQAGSVVGKYITNHQVPEEKFFRYCFDEEGGSLHFYSKRIVGATHALDLLDHGVYLLTKEEGLSEIAENGRPYEVVFEGLDFHVAVLNGKFLNPASRKSASTPYFIVKLK